MDERALGADLTVAHELADVAATVTMARFGERLPVTMKDDDTPVTEVDRAAERAIREALAARLPRDAVLGEEEGGDGTSSRTWIVDPIDGTKLFAEGIPLWTTLIALAVDGVPVVGVADAPALGRRYHAARGTGAWCGERRLTVSTIARLGEAFVAHSPIEGWIAAHDQEALLRLTGLARGTRGLSDAWGHLLVAQGSLDASVEREPCFPWDWSATQVIVEEAGGRLTTLAGAPPSPGSDLLISNDAVHARMVEALAIDSAR